MLIASKLEEIIPFKVSTVVKKMTHNSILAEKIIEMEKTILEALDFNLMRSPSIFVFLENLIVKLNFHLKIGF